MTPPRKHIVTCPHCNHPAYSGMVGGRCYICATHTISAASLLAVQAERLHHFEVDGITR